MKRPGSSWLESPIRCSGRTVRPPLSPDQIHDATLPEICLRMHLILDSIEYERAEGRLINRDIFESIDSLHSNLVHLPVNHLEDWQDSIVRFGEYYRLSPDVPIEVTARAVAPWRISSVSRFH